MTEVKRRAREMRKTLSPPEARLWSVLKTWRGRGYQFRRQAPLLGYYLDFVCFSQKLIVEVDGTHHDAPDQLRHDRRRDARLAAEGFRTLRIAAIDIRDNLDGVAEMIWRQLQPDPTRAPLRSAVPPHEGEGDR